MKNTDHTSSNSGTCQQALKSGQLPADLKSMNDNITLDNVNEKHEDMVHGESNDTRDQINNDSTLMEQV